MISLTSTFKTLNKLSLEIYIYIFFASRHRLKNYHWLLIISTCEKYSPSLLSFTPKMMKYI